MEKTIINPETLGPAVGPFSRAVQLDNVLYIAGTSAFSHLAGPFDYRYLPPSIEEQAKLTFDNVQKVVEAAAGTMADIFKITLMIKHRADYAVVNDIRAAYFPERSLISTGFQCELLRDDMLIEVDAMALIE
jgi:enamine deaminase RidA (YjgF/YER057c/UK114 family)